MKVLISDNLSEKGVEIFQKDKRISVDVKTGLSKDELIKIIPEYDALVIRSATKVTPDVIEAAVNLKVVGRAGIGVDNVDLEAASKHGIVVMNTPGGNTETTAEHAISMMLALARKIPQANVSIKSNKWEKKKFMGVEILNKTLGVIGLGRIGRIVVKRAQGLGMRIVAFDPFISKEAAKKLNVELAGDLNRLLKTADFITIHTPKTEETANFLGEREFNIMKNGVRIVNCARGGIIDEKALYNAIKSEKVAGAALDVFEKEPPVDNPLLTLEEVICTPHIGASTDEAQENVAIAVAEQIINYLCNGEIRNAVNVPSMDADMLERVKPYISLGEKLGSLQAQLTDGGIKKINITYSGEVVDLDVKYITLSVLKGLLDVFIKEDINLINAPIIAKERGIEVIETTISDVKDYAGLLSTAVETDRGKKVIDGTIFGKSEPRIVRIDGYILEAAPSGNMLIFSNEDAPGVIGHIGTFLGKHNINIAGMHLGRTKVQGNAMSIVNIDSPLPENLLKGVRDLPNMIYVKMVKL